MAVTGRHFSNRSALGSAVEKNTRLISTGAGIELVSVPIRNCDGAPRPVHDIDAEVASLTQEAIQDGRRILLIVVDVSKTGMIAPSPQCAFHLRDANPGKIEVMIDACQFRLAPPSLHAYIDNGAIVALTGSKFVTGPSFSGALLVPGPLAVRYRTQQLPATLSAYSARADWPEHWPGAAKLANTTNFGLLLRWEAALTELKRFRTIPPVQVAGIISRLGAAIEELLSIHPAFLPLPVPHIDRGLQTGGHWDSFQTIYPFFLMRQAGDRRPVPLSHVETASVHHILQAPRPDLPFAIRCQLGQPVACAALDGVAVSALRICISTRHVVEAAIHGEADVIKMASAALDLTASELDTRECSSAVQA